MRRLALALLGIVVGASAAWGQSSPFDMSGEKSGGQMIEPAAPLSPAPAATYPPPLNLQPQTAVPPAAGAPDGVPMTVPMTVPSLRPREDAAPRMVAPGLQPAPAVAPAVPAVSAMPPPAAVDPATASAASAAGGKTWNGRYIIPEQGLRLAGENDERAWTIFLTAGEAAAKSHIQVSYENALVVMPEASRLRISINGIVVLEAPLASSDSFKSLEAEIPPNTLQAGANLMRIEAIQRHRTDCSVQSTYELWTDIDPAGTQLVFDDDAAARVPVTLEDLPAIGYDATGRTNINLVTPQAREAAVAPLLVKLSQSIALYGRYPNPSVTISSDVDASAGPGTLTVLVAPAADLAQLAGRPVEVVERQPVVSFVPGAKAGEVILVVSGADWGQVQAAIEAMAARVDRPLDVSRSALTTAAWFAPDVHFFTGADAISLAEMGVSTRQFSGRRFRVVFGVGLPSDFYAEAYGNATLLLDAAYTPAVLPASHIDIYVNGEIAATTRIVNSSGGIFRHFPIQIPFRHFHPGVNRIAIEAALDTKEDLACGPGGSIAGPDRFALFDSSEFSMPKFARIARMPNLAAFAATGFPYNRKAEASALVLPRTNAQTVAAASTLLARLAMQAARIVPITLVSAASVGDRPAIFVGSAAQMPPELLRALDVNANIRSAWRPDTNFGGGAAGVQGGALARPAVQEERASTGELFNQWRDQLSDGGGWRGQISGLEDWLKRTFDISFSKLRLGPASRREFDPPVKSSLLLAQGASPGGGAAWTLLTAPTDEQLLSATRSMVEVETWSQIEGQFSSYSASTGRVQNEAPTDVSFITTQPLTPGNLRLIAANWLSSNITFYAIGLITMCILLGIVTSGLLHRLGRPS